MMHRPQNPNQMFFSADSRLFTCFLVGLYIGVCNARSDDPGLNDFVVNMAVFISARLSENVNQGLDRAIAVSLGVVTGFYATRGFDTVLSPRLAG